MFRILHAEVKYIRENIRVTQPYLYGKLQQFTSDPFLCPQVLTKSLGAFLLVFDCNLDQFKTSSDRNKIFKAERTNRLVFGDFRIDGLDRDDRQHDNSLNTYCQYRLHTSSIPLYKYISREKRKSPYWLKERK